MSPISPEITHLTECLKKQADCYVQLLALARDQQKAIQEENDADLLQAVQGKNPLLQTLQQLDQDMQTGLQNLSEADRTLMTQKAQALKEEATQTLEELIAIEDACAKILKDKKEEAFEQLKILQERKPGLKGYRDPGGKSSRFSQEG